MGRPKKNETSSLEILDVTEDCLTTESPESETIATKSETKEDSSQTLPENVQMAMRLYPQYEEMWITDKGFVHPIGVPEYALKNAKLYKNKYFNK